MLNAAYADIGYFPYDGVEGYRGVLVNGLDIIMEKEDLLPRQAAKSIGHNLWFRLEKVEERLMERGVLEQEDRKSPHYSVFSQSPYE